VVLKHSDGASFERQRHSAQISTIKYSLHDIDDSTLYCDVSSSQLV
jgi:hypothetical protein